MKKVRKLFNVALIAVVVAGVALLSGCTTYYKVKDTSTSSTYYTTQIDRQSSGSIRFVDENSKSVVTLQNSAVTEVNEEEFKANTKKK
jgi:outer membrane murein-binding lipoprotein Lpp